MNGEVPRVNRYKGAKILIVSSGASKFDRQRMRDGISMQSHRDCDFSLPSRGTVAGDLPRGLLVDSFSPSRGQPSRDRILRADARKKCDPFFLFSF